MIDTNFKHNLTKFPTKDELELLASASGRILYTTSALRALLGEDICGRNLNDVLPDEDVAALITACAGGKTHSFSGRLCSVAVSCEMEPRESDLLITVYPASPIGVPSITPATAELICREMNMNLSTMFISLDSYQGKLAPDARANPELAIILRGLYQMMRLSRNMLDTSLFEAGKMVLYPQCHDLQQLCTRISERVSPICKALGIGFEFVGTTDDMNFLFDEERVERVIMNLICNSIQYTRNGNSITLKIAIRGDSAVIVVADRGLGISPAILPDIFEKHIFADASSPSSMGGAGFGFALAKAVSHMHSGTCLITSNFGAGTNVTLTLPLKKPDGKSLSSPPRPDYAGGKSHVLLELSSALPLEFYAK